MLLDMHKSIPQSWMESLLPEVLSCDPSLGLASSWRHKPCAQMCWAQSIHPCVPQTGVREQFFGTGRVFLLQYSFKLFLVDLHCAVSSGHFRAGLLLGQWQWWWWVCTLFITEKDLFLIPQPEKSWGGISAPTAELQRPEKHSKTLNSDREYPFQFVSGVQSRLRKERLVFQRQGRPWMCWCVLLRGKPVQQEWYTQVFCSTFFFPSCRWWQSIEVARVQPVSIDQLLLSVLRYHIYLISRGTK